MFISILLLLNPRLLMHGLACQLAQALYVLCLLHFRGRPTPSHPGWHRPAAAIAAAHEHTPAPWCGRRKPDWVRREVLRLAVHVHSCRGIAEVFNRIHGQRTTVRKTFVHELCRAHAAFIAERRRAMRRRPAGVVAPNAVWGLDLTQLPHSRHMALAILDHGSRRVLRLRVLARKHAWALLSHVCQAIGEFGMPAAIRTDNEGMFASRVWRLAFSCFGIRHQRIRPHCPWENGRVERLFGTLKPLLRGLALPSQAAAQMALDEFSCFYNHARPHQGLGGLTPIEAWHGMTRQDVLRHAGRGRWVYALSGRLVGYHLRL
jgi:putative transposase